MTPRSRAIGSNSSDGVTAKLVASDDADAPIWKTIKSSTIGSGRATLPE